MKHYLAVAILFVMLYSCKKEESRQYSKWYVNTDSFYTNDVRTDRGKGQHDIESNDPKNCFSLSFLLGFYPKEGAYPVGCKGPDPRWACLVIIYKGAAYLSPKNAYLQTGEINGKATYTLQPAWFYHEANITDSVLVKGAFNEP